MADNTDVLLKFCEQQWMEAKQAEDQRATVTNIILVIASVIVGYITQNSITPEKLPLTILLIVLGIFGGITSEKLYERHQFHSARAWSWRERIDQLHPEAELERRKKLAVVGHNKKFPIISKVHLHYLWLLLHLSIAIAGVILTVIALL